MTGVQTCALPIYRIHALQLTSAIDGIWMAPQVDRFRHGFVERGQELGAVIPRGDMLVRVAADQHLGPRLVGERDGASVELRLRNRPDRTFGGRISRILPAGQRDLPSAALAMPAGGQLQIDPESAQEPQSSEPFFLVDIRPDQSAVPLLVGQRMVVRFELSPKPLAVQWWRALRQLLQQRFQI